MSLEGEITLYAEERNREVFMMLVEAAFTGRPTPLLTSTFPGMPSGTYRVLRVEVDGADHWSRGEVRAKMRWESAEIDTPPGGGVQA